MAEKFESLIKLAKERGPRKIAVAVAEDKEVLGSIKLGLDEEIIEPILVGDEEKIRDIGEEINLDLSKVEIVNAEDGLTASRTATKIVSSGKADVLMKGIIDTPTIMRQVLDADIGLRVGKLISHVTVFEVPTYHKIFLVSDAAMNIAPNLEQKKEIIDNAVDIAHSLEIEEPKVAVLAANEKVSSKMEATQHAEELAKMNKEGKITGCIVDGPFALDNAVSKESAITKGIESEVAGDADILLVPTIEAGNILYKSLSFLGNAKSAGLITGTKAPIVLTSRADKEEAKLYSIVLAVLMASKED